MWTDRLWSVLDAHVLDEPAGDRLVNPYRDADPALDAPGAPEIRRANLRASIDAVGARPEVLVVAEAPGPWGCRFSGVPFTNERQLLDPDFPVHGRPTSRQYETTGEPLTEYSGNLYWRAMLPHWGRFWTWNAVPFHPHKAGEPLTIRTPGVREVRRWHAALAAVVEAIQPRLCVAVGRKAEGSLAAVGAAPIYVRHPSQGGAMKFATGIADVWASLE